MKKEGKAFLKKMETPVPLQHFNQHKWESLEVKMKKIIKKMDPP